MAADGRRVSDQAAVVRGSLRGRRVGAGLLAGLVALVVAALVSTVLRLPATQERARGWEIHTYRVLLSSRDVLIATQRAELAARAYVLGRDPEILKTFRERVAEAPVAVDALAALVSDNATELNRVAELKSALTQHLSTLESSVAFAQAGNTAQATAIDRDGSDTRELQGLRTRIERIIAAEESLLETRTARARSDALNTRLGLYALSAAGMLLLLGAAYALVRLNRASERLAIAEVEARAGEELERARDFLQAVVDGAPDPIFVKDREGRFLLANLRMAKVYDTDPAAMMGKTDAHFVARDLAATLRDSDQRVMLSGKAELVEERLLEGGEWRTYLSAKAPWRRNGEVIGLIGVARDITDRKTAEVALQTLNDELEARVEARTREIERAEAQIRQMQKMESIGQLTGGIAHDFNNMLAIVLGSLEIAARNLESDQAKTRRFLINAQEGATRAATLTARLLAFSRQQPLEPESLDANKLVSGMSEMLQRTLGEQVQLETVLAGGLWRTLVDPGELENTLVNLCVNARDAMPAGGKLTVETANAHLDEPYAANHDEVIAGQYVLICVSDTGCGIAPDIVERVFDPFFTTKPVGRGTGLGLSQVYGFIKQSGGHVKIYSEVDHGTTVKIYLPRYFGPQVTRGAPPVSNVEAPRGSASETILVVEDEAAVRNMSVDALRELGYTVMHADGPLSAMTMISELSSLALLFTDVIMPEMNGRELAERAVAMRPNLKVLYTTGYTRNAVVHNGVLDPGLAFLNKPYTLEQLATKVRQVLDS